MNIRAAKELFKESCYRLHATSSTQIYKTDNEYYLTLKRQLNYSDELSLSVMAKKWAFLLAFLVSQILIVKAQTPTAHSSGISISTVYCHSFVVTWSKGNGSDRIVFVKEGSAVNSTPSDNYSYSAKDSFGKGSELGTGNYAVYAGTGNSFTLRNLKKNTTYYLAIFEYNNGTGQNMYYTESSYAVANKKTEDITSNFSIDKTYQCLADNSFSFTNSSSNSLGNSMTYSWDFGDKSGTSTQTNPTYVYSTGSIFKVVLTASSLGCKTSTTLLDTVGVPFVTYFELDKSISGNDSVQCFTSNQYNLLNKFKVPAPIYGTWDRTKNLWTTSQGHKGTAFDFDFIAKQEGKITVTLVQSRQVSKGGVYCVDSFKRDFYILPPPLKTVDVSFSDTLLCLNEGDFTFSHKASNITSTSWKFGDGGISSSNPANHSYASIGKYQVSLNVVDNYGCKGSFEDSVEVVTTPDNFFTGLKQIYCVNDQVAKLKPNLSGGLFKGGNVSAMDSTFNPLSVGKFTVSYIYKVGNCIDTFSAQTEVKDRPKFYIGPDTFICPNNKITLDVGVDGLTYLWSTNETTRSIEVNAGGTYWAKASNGFCDGADTAVIKALKLPVLELGMDTTICGGQKISYNIKTDAGTILWSDGNTSFNRDITTSGKYSVTITHPCGIVTDDIELNILPYACEMFIPNIFSPNGDILNELFYPLGFFEFTDMLIFDEYGMKLYETDDLSKGWNGTYNGADCQQGMYYYLIRYQLPENGSYVKKVAKGSIYLIR